jgi:hypothetical protein
MQFDNRTIQTVTGNGEVGKRYDVIGEDSTC